MSFISAHERFCDDAHPITGACNHRLAKEPPNQVAFIPLAGVARRLRLRNVAGTVAFARWVEASLGRIERAIAVAL